VLYEAAMSFSHPGVSVRFRQHKVYELDDETETLLAAAIEKGKLRKVPTDGRSRAEYLPPARFGVPADQEALVPSGTYYNTGGTYTGGGQYPRGPRVDGDPDDVTGDGDNDDDSTVDSGDADSADDVVSESGESSSSPEQ
jgi:hypothetical protein